jgi:hypothetical protein
MGLRDEVERAARRAPLLGRLVPSPARRATPPPPRPPAATGEAPDLLGALDAARDRLRTAIPPRDDED